MVDVERLRDNYTNVFPDRPSLSASKGWLTGTWTIGACYKNPNPLYGAFPRGYLNRVHSLFPDARNILHVFSGGLTADHAREACGDHASLVNIELVDIHGPDQGRYPTWKGNVLNMPEEWDSRFDLIIADPPYSAADAIKYACPSPNRGKITNALRRVASTGASLVWLDTVWPMHQKKLWKCYGHIGLVRSTNHRMRLVSLFEAQ